MKFPRNARVFRGQLDAAPFASVFFLLLIFILLGTLVYTPGVVIHLPPSPDQPAGGVLGETIAVAIDANGQYYFRNRPVRGSELAGELRSAMAAAPAPLTLIVQADAKASRETLDQIAAIARQAGIHDMLLATLPRLYSTPATPSIPR